MKIRTMIWMMICSSIISSAVFAIPANDYVQSGRLWLFQGTLTGLRNGYAILDAGMNDAGCPDCATSRELIFFHALSRISMWAVRNDGAPTDSAFELAEQNGISIVGNWIQDMEITNNWQVNRYDAYDLPADLESIIDNIMSSIGSDGLTEINSVLKELDRITETPDNRFRIFLTPEETHAFMDPLSPQLSYNLEVDYADVLLLKGILSAVKAEIHTLSAYDLNVSNKQDIIKKWYGDCFSVNGDLLLPNPDFFKVLPSDGDQTLAQARQAWIEALTYYQLMMDSMEQEDIPAGLDPQDDELFYIEPEDQSQNQKYRDLLGQLQASLQNDTVLNYISKTTKTYNIQCADCGGGQTLGQLELDLNILDQAEEGMLTMTQCAGIPARWALDGIEISDSDLFATLNYDGSEISYHGNYDLSYAPSVLLTPVECQANASYQVDVLPTCQFSETGAAQGWNADNSIWDYALPFVFSFFGTNYSQIHISTNGFVCFDTDTYNNYWELENHIRIQPLGYDLRTDYYGGSDIYISQPAPDQVMIRWAASDYNWNYFNFAVVLYSNGSIRFDYGSGNMNVYPHIGISNGTPGSVMPLGNGWGGGYLSGTISPDKSTITNLQLDFWGQPQTTLAGLTAGLQETRTEDITLDLNPLLGSTARYPDPVSPRDLLPEFNAWNTPAPSTVGHGIGDDPTLGGFLPGKTQLDWDKLGFLQPAAHLDWQEILPWQKVDGWVGFWLDEQLVFADTVGDLLFEESDIEDVPGADIAALYIGYDMDYIHGEIVCNGPLEDKYYGYDITLSYCPTQPDSLNAMRVHIDVENNTVQSASVLLRIGDQYSSYWEDIITIDAQMEGNYIDFRIPWTDIPAAVNGRYLTIDSTWGYEQWDSLAEDNNPTQIQIGTAGTLSGTISYNGFTGAPIYIQAFTDLYEPEESIVASTLITAPGPYQLQGIGLGWEGYIRVFTPLFGLNITDLDAMNIESMAQVSQRYPQVRNVNLTLQNPVVLQQNSWTTGQLNVHSNRTDIYAFDAIAGVEYLLEIEPLSPTDFGLDLMDRNGNEALFETVGNYTQSIYWTFPVNGRYYFKVENWNWDNGNTADYQLRYSSDITCPLPDISGSQWSGVRDCYVDFYDFALLAKHWLESCNYPYWCDDSDFDKTHQVDMADFARLIDEWLISGLFIDPGE